MKPLILLLLLALSAPLVHARLGETIEECEKRYGKAVEKQPATMPDSDPEAHVFSAKGVWIITEFKSGKAWKTVYRSPIDQTDGLLELEKTEGGWSSVINVGPLAYRISADRERMSVVQPPKSSRDPIIVTFVTKAYAAANRALYDGKLGAVSDEVKRRMQQNPLNSL